MSEQAVASPTREARLSDDEVQAVDRLRETHQKLRDQLARVIVGQQDVKEAQRGLWVSVVVDVQRESAGQISG